ncbi:hypothetical protein JQ543_06710 [Bradyrhizobium diazoefficiens]|nr:hypothetical protein [Bradyrhizobium diazoefficiens]MBR0847426.1 hypothetical protein [Bradyrhizobium diazoefficiens]
MTKLDHNRPILRLIDDLKKLLSQANSGGSDPVRSAAPRFQPSSLAQLKRQTGSWGARSLVDAKAEIHRAACSVLVHVGKHNDVRVATWLVEAIPPVYRKSVQDWFESFGPITFDGGKASFNPMNPIRLGNAIDAPFWRLKRRR